MVLPRLHQRHAVVALGVLFLFFLLHRAAPSTVGWHDDAFFSDWNSEPFIRPLAHDVLGGSAEGADLCSRFPPELFKRVQVVLKTGAAEDKRKIETSLSTVLSCIPNLLVVSDLEEKVGKFDAVDVLANLTAPYTTHEDFAVYLSQQELHRTGKQSGGPGAQGWRLDRFKFLPMVEQAALKRPEAAWYVFVEADTYVSWDTLFRFLDHFDPSVPLYMGSPVPGGSRRWFAHGGSGFVLSAGAVEKFLARRVGRYGNYVEPSVTTAYAGIAISDCCGDAALAYAMIKKGIKLDGYYPLFSGDNSEGALIHPDNWCSPLLSMHHVGSDEMPRLWEWEMGRKNNTNPILYADLYHFLYPSEQQPRRQDWDNLSTHKASSGAAHSSAQTCENACKRDRSCLQWSYNGVCRLEGSVKLGFAVKSNEKATVSGWDLDKINAMKANDCGRIRWPKPSYERHG